VEKGAVMQRTHGLAPLLTGLVACSSSSSSTAPVAAEPPVSVSMQLTVGAGQELHQCQFVTLPNDAGIDVVGISHEYTAGSHHFLVFMTDLDTIPADMQGQYDCVHGDEPIMQHARAVIYGAQSPIGTTSFPDGVGFGMKAHQVLMLQAHYINTSPQDLAASVSVTFATAAADKLTTKAGFLVFYDPFIYVPAQGGATSGIRCAVGGNINLISAFTHYHQRGTSMRVWVDPSMSTASETPFYATADWEHPQDFKGPMAVSAGSVFRFQCDYTNGDSFEVFQGPNAATSEMCVFASLYYPALGDVFENCADLSVIGTGSQACTDLLSCVQGCPASDAPQANMGGVNVGGCWEKCVATGCQGATDTLLPVTTCAGTECQTDCAESSDACSVCMASKCTDEVGACAEHTCAP
jgi:hypothetical protein